MVVKSEYAPALRLLFETTIKPSKRENINYSNTCDNNYGFTSRQHLGRNARIHAAHTSKRNQTPSSEICAPFAPGTLVMSYCMLATEGDALPPGVPVASS